MSFAPSEKEISWTDYNTVGEVWDYFGCYSETAAMHYGDTMKVMGYIVPGTLGIVDSFNYESNIIPTGGSSLYLDMGNYWDVPNNKQHVLFLYGNLGDSESNNAEVMAKFEDYQWGQKVYATVVIMSRAVDEFCCDSPVLKPIEVEIGNKEGEK